jgi:hypothetical protein
VLLTLVCVLLVVVLGAVQVAHSHADRADVHANCTLCVTAHVSVHPVRTPAPVPAVAVAALLEVAAPPARVRSTLRPFALFTRPPPLSALPA